MKDNIIFNHSTIYGISDQSYNLHIHDYYEIYYFIKGDVNYYIDGQYYKLEEKDVLIINPKELHRPFFDSNEKYQRVTIHFLPEYISYFNTSSYNLLNCFENRKQGHFNKLSSSEVKEYKIDKLIESMELYKDKTSEEDKILLLTAFINLLVALNKAYHNNINLKDKISPCKDERVTKVLDFINSNLEEKLSLDLLEKNCFVNKYYLCHIFKKSTGFTVLEYINYKRIIKAKELLSLGMPVIDVSSAVGFQDYSNFYKIFKKTIGVSPKHFLTGI